MNARLRERIPGIALSTEVIVGFPSETEKHFRQTADLLSALKFDTVHIAAYSPRAGTAAAELDDNIPPAVKKERLDIVEKLQAGIATEINDRLRGETAEILVEGRKKDKWYGRTRSDKLVFFSSNCARAGQLIEVKINHTSPWSLQGTVA